MLNYVLRRVLYSIPVVLIASFLLFAFVRSTFDPTARLRASRDKSVVERERERLGLNDSLVVQYGTWLKDAVRGDLGQSSRSGEEVSSMVSRAMGNTLQLVVWGVLFSSVTAVGIGVYSAVKQYSAGDYAFTGLSYIGIAMPPFWFGLIAIEIFAVRYDVFLSLGLHSGDSSGVDLDYFRHLALPVATLSVQIVASWSRFQRASMLDVLSADYVRTAQAKGVPQRRVIMKHALRNALIPLITVMSLDIGAIFGGLIITEQIFSIGGMGRLFYNALLQGDVNVLEAWMVIVALCIIGFNLLADVLYGVLDPRIRLS
jgi:peptide/nickel transport system permease protein